MNIQIENLGPIKRADVNITDLTVLIGPQATGKTIFLQTFKLYQDIDSITKTINESAIGYWKNYKDFQEVYFGQGVRGIINAKSSIKIDDNKMKLKDLIPESKSTNQNVDKSVFYIPAQRSLVIDNGWPRNITNFPPTFPFVVREYSESIRQYLDFGFEKKDKDILFPMIGVIDADVKQLFINDIFRDGVIKINKSTQKTILMDTANYNGKIPITSWSTGQREFFPLLLSFYSVTGRGKGATINGDIYFIIEEPEMGLHPRAIFSFMYLVMDILTRGYKVIISTHSVYILEILWALTRMKKKLNDVPERKEEIYKLFFQLFQLKKRPNLMRIPENVLGKNFSAFFFNPERTEAGSIKSSTVDISSLDPGSENVDISGWGDLTGKSGDVSDIVAELANLG